MMNAAVVHSFDLPPHFESFAEPAPSGDEVLVHVTAAALNPSTRLLASGRHYASPQQLPVICGVEGVGRLDDGTRVFFGVRRPPNGSMCQRTAVPRSFCWPVPDGVDDAVAAALPNPGLSSWLPLITSARLAPGESVLILGATGVAGQLAIQIAKHLGAGRVVAAGRNENLLAELPELGADATIRLGLPDVDVAEAFSQAGGAAGFDIVLDYLWGHPTEVLLAAATRRGFPSARSGTRLVQIGDSAGPLISLPATALRSATITIVGSGAMPSLSVLSKAFEQLMNLAARGQLRIKVEPVPLVDIGKAWTRTELHGRRLVMTP
jgi:NADPH:quinone reductase-like Zn-dependent oxidoreductase